MAEPWQLTLYRRSFKKKLTMKALLDHLPPVEGRRCLELGCATGLTSYFLRQRGGQWTSCDFERDHTRSAQRLLGAGVVQSSDAEVPFRDGTFDVVVAINFLEHIEDDRRYFRDMVRVLRPGGDFLFLAPRGETGRPGYAVKKVLGFTAAQGGFGHARDGYSPAAARQLFVDSGLEVLGEDTYCRFFTEFLEDMLNFAYHRKSAAEQPEADQDFHGSTAPMSEQALSNVGLAYRVFTAVHPLLRLWTALDVLIPFTGGYMLSMWGRKLGAASTAPTRP
jgi:SAM-dependent methyltransferase